LTLQQIADIIGTSKPNVCVIEKGAHENIRRAKATLDSLWTLNTTPICTLKAGTDLFDVIPLFYDGAAKRTIKLPEDPIELINRLREENPYSIRGRLIRRDINVYLKDDGDVKFRGSFAESPEPGYMGNRNRDRSRVRTNNPGE